jgi:hypothetical protein
MNWAILKYETGRHSAIPNSLCRLGIPCILPLIEEYNPQAKRHITKPALTGLLFLPAQEQTVQLALDRVRYIESVWRLKSGALIAIQNDELQFFLDKLENRSKKTKKDPRAKNLADMALKDWFDVCHKKFGLQAAIKQFGVDLRERDAA